MVKCTLWEGFAQRMQTFLDAQATTVPVVVLIHQARVNKFLSKLIFFRLHFNSATL